MAEPVSTVAVIEAAAAAVGAVHAVAGSASGDTGFNVGACNVHYPKEFPPSQFAHAGQAVSWDVIKFHAHGGFWDNDLTISASGWLSQDDGPLLVHPVSANPRVPVNRFLLLNLDKSGTSENMSRGLLNVAIAPWGGAGDIAEGTPEDPWVMLRVTGRFDPFGPGDMQYSFQLGINSFGRLSLGHVSYNGDVWDDFSITHQGDHILVYLN